MFAAHIDHETPTIQQWTSGQPTKSHDQRTTTQTFESRAWKIVAAKSVVLDSQ